LEISNFQFDVTRFDIAFAPEDVLSTAEILQRNEPETPEEIYWRACSDG
jgi:hypothetical protein